MALLLPPKTISRSISKPEILSSTSLDKMRLLPLTQSSLILQSLLMDPPWPKFSAAKTPGYVMHMVSRAPSNSSTPWLIISGIGEPCTPLSVMEASMKSPRRSLTSFDHSLMLITSLNPIISTKTRLRIDGYCQEMSQLDHEFILLTSFYLASLPLICLCPPQSHVFSSPGWTPSPPGPDRTDSRHQFSASFFLVGTYLLQN